MGIDLYMGLYTDGSKSNQFHNSLATSHHQLLLDLTLLNMRDGPVNDVLGLYTGMSL